MKTRIFGRKGTVWTEEEQAEWEKLYKKGHLSKELSRAEAIRFLEDRKAQVKREGKTNEVKKHEELIKLMKSLDK